MLISEKTTPVGAVPGTYLLLLDLSSAGRLPVGRTRSAWFEAGLYGYIGSALGSGGLAARLKRYAADPVRKHWHIDYLLDHARLVGALVKSDNRRLECRWADWVSRRAVAAVDGFGASDCRCRAHLFRLGRASDLDRFLGPARKGLRGHYVSKGEMIRSPVRPNPDLSP